MKTHILNRRDTMKTRILGYANPNGHGAIIHSERDGMHYVVSEPDMEDESGEVFYSERAARTYFAERVSFWQRQPNVDAYVPNAMAGQPNVDAYVPNAMAGQPSPASNWR